jgi:hypothetical protein
MKSLPVKYFGPEGLPCVFDVDGNGTPAIGYLKKQISNYYFIVTDGDNEIFNIIAIGRNVNILELVNEE